MVELLMNFRACFSEVSLSSTRPDESTRKRLETLCREVFARPFYRQYFRDVGWLASSAKSAGFSLESLPLLTKQQLVTRAQSGQSVFDLPPEQYVRWHQTSGTTGRPFVVRDTAEDWRWWLVCWQRILDAAKVTSNDVALMAFSFGPFIGFWTANDALVGRGATVIPGGGLSTRARLQILVDHNVTIVCATPTYALHMAAVATQDGLDLASTSVRQIIVAGEPGGSIPATRRRISEAFGAEVTDHAGGSEIGAWGYGDPVGKGLYVNEAEFIAEVIDFSDPDHPKDIGRGETDIDGLTGELVLTNLGRSGGPAIRYRTGDIVRPAVAPTAEAPTAEATPLDTNLWLAGGVVGRADDMVVIRGVNIFPSSVESVVRQRLASEEFRVTVSREGEMDQLNVEVECDSAAAKDLSDLLSDRLAIRIAVQSVTEGTLPRYEAKSRRWIDRRND